ncbi:protein kinase domain-containing protein [Frigoribacterium salinisoli]
MAENVGNATGRLLGGRYRLGEVVGRGGMSSVFSAVDESLGRQVAVKVFRPGVADRARQDAELAVLATLDHHGLVGLLDAGFVDGDGGRQRYLVMPLITGQDLEERLTGGPIASRHIAEIGYDMAEALEYIHERGIVHRDIKPSNILLVDYGDAASRAHARLTDFGIALADESERLTAEGVTTGTAAYLSPEQARGGDIGPASDVYALGLVLLQCFTRRREFPGSLVESAVARLTRDPALPEPLPEHWREALRAMTSREPADRPVGEDLVSVLRQVVIAESSRHRDEEPFDPTGGTGQVDETGPDTVSITTATDQALERAATMAARLLQAPIAIMSAADHGQTWFVKHFDDTLAHLDDRVDLSPSMATAAEPIVIEDASADPRVKDSPLVTGSLGLRFYAGVPLTRDDGVTIGTLSVVDRKPRQVTADDLQNLGDLAALVVAQIAAVPDDLGGTATGGVPSQQA